VENSARAHRILGLLLGAALVAGCTLRQTTTAAASGSDSSQPSSAPVAAAANVTPAVPQLPFKGRLVQGDRDELPPALAAALAENSPVTFAYREQLSHDEYHIPLIVSALDPVTWFGAPLGDFGVTAFATLTVSDGDAVLADYTAKAFVSRPYTLYSSPTHRELETAARAAVRAKIDEKLGRDADRLAQEVGAAAVRSDAR
jgi:hypothetical protein